MLRIQKKEQEEEKVKTEQCVMCILWTDSKMLANHNVTTHFGHISIMLNEKYVKQTSLTSQW